MQKLENEHDAIKQAVEAGYMLPVNSDFLGVEMDVPNLRWYLRFYDKRANQSDTYTFCLPDTFQDLAFWQALGKARGWNMLESRKHIDHLEDGRTSYDDEVRRFSYYESDPEYHALRYFETRLSNGDTQAFWQSLP
jgi:hypothetical protein